MNTDYALFHCDQIAVDVLWGVSRKVSPIIKLQGFEMDDLDKALDRLNYLIAHMRCVRTFTLNNETSSTKEVDAMIEKLLDADNVRLECLKVRRRYVSQRFALLSDLIATNAESLRIVGRIGLSEAIHLERLSLMNFDLVSDNELEHPLLEQRTRDCIRRLGGLGSTSWHLSFTCFSGFEITRNPTLFMLKQLGVRSLRLTMQKGTPITDPSTFGPVKPVLESLERLELVGLMNAPRERLSALFPNLEFYNLDRTEFERNEQRAQAVKPVEEIVKTDLLQNRRFSLVQESEQTAVCCN
ncbi:hypothetical protein M3Y96_00659500 [Aphelenchoides besseyi]|nr:hypothetical protein M3Y96_00659500 [Aphelenchoides besseyi]